MLTVGFCFLRRVDPVDPGDPGSWHRRVPVSMESGHTARISWKFPAEVTYPSWFPASWNIVSCCHVHHPLPRTCVRHRSGDAPSRNEVLVGSVLPVIWLVKPWCFWGLSTSCSHPKNTRENGPNRDFRHFWVESRRIVRFYKAVTAYQVLQDPWPTWGEPSQGTNLRPHVFGPGGTKVLGIAHRGAVGWSPMFFRGVP